MLGAAVIAGETTNLKLFYLRLFPLFSAPGIWQILWPILTILRFDYVYKICCYCSVNINVLYVKLKTSFSNVLRRGFKEEERDLGFITIIITIKKRNWHKKRWILYDARYY
jgi:hypothetical protein